MKIPKILKIKKGSLSVGNEADFCIVDINNPWVVKNKNLLLTLFILHKIQFFLYSIIIKLTNFI